MRSFIWILTQAKMLMIVLSVALSGFGMANAHTAMALDHANLSGDAHGVDHSGHAMHKMGEQAAHATMDSHSGSSHHEGHKTCPMIACCHIGCTEAKVSASKGEPVEFLYAKNDRAFTAKAEPEKAKKPPKFV